MVDTGTVSIENQVSRKQLAGADPRTAVRLRPGRMRQADAVMGKDGKYEPGTVRASGQAGTSPYIGIADKLACIIAAMLDDKLGKEISILNISHVSSLADYFVIVTGDSTPHVKALMETVKERTKKELDRAPLRVENDAKNRWNLLDFGDVVVHILHKDERETYAIEKFWSNAFSIPEEEWRENSKEFSKYNK